MTTTAIAPEELNRRLGRRIRNMMFGRMTQADLAKAIGTTQSGMSRRIRGTTEFTPYELLITARKLNTTVDALLSEMQPLDYKTTVRAGEVVDIATRQRATRQVLLAAA